MEEKVFCQKSVNKTMMITSFSIVVQRFKCMILFFQFDHRQQSISKLKFSVGKVDVFTQLQKYQ